MEHGPRGRELSGDDGKNGILLTPLSGLASGRTGVVNYLEGDKEVRRRLASLGFTIGAQVTVLQNAGPGPMIVSMLGAHIALGRQEAGLVQVQPL